MRAQALACKSLPTADIVMHHIIQAMNRLHPESGKMRRGPGSWVYPACGIPRSYPLTGMLRDPYHPSGQQDPCQPSSRTPLLAPAGPSLCTFLRRGEGQRSQLNNRSQLVAFPDCGGLGVGIPRSGVPSRAGAPCLS